MFRFHDVTHLRPGRTTVFMPGAMVTPFPKALADAVCVRGSILAVALHLGVSPQAVYRWIAGFELPDQKEQGRMMALLLTPRAA